MDREIPVFIKIGVTMIILSAVLSFMFLISGSARTLANLVITPVDNAYVSNANYDWLALAEYGDPIPVASLYALIVKDEGKVKSISGNVYSVNVTNISDLTRLFSRDVLCTITKSNDDRFDIILEEE